MNPAGRRLLLPFLSLPLLLLAGRFGDLQAASPPATGDGNRLVYLDGDDPFHAGLAFPKLTTPQWIGEPGVEAAVILSIDDMRSPEKYEKFIRPILERLKRIDGRAPLSILANAVTPTDPQYQAWLKEGVSLEVHTLSHPCPCLAKGDFDAAAATYHGGVELLNQVPGNRPVAFRMPCCDSMNSPSPRFYADVFNRANEAGQFLTIDSSVMNITTPKDPTLPRKLVLDSGGGEKFRKYLPTETNATTRVSMGSFVTTIEDYPYPYAIGRLCWEFPAGMPSDWEAFNLHGATNPITLADWKAGLDATVLKQGLFTFIFHPHGWSSPEQFVEFIDYAVSKYGRKVRFLNFREAGERLDRNLLGGVSLRSQNGQDTGVRLLDLNDDGFMDVVIAGADKDQRRARVWNPRRGRWTETGFPAPGVETAGREFTRDAGLRFGIVRSSVIALSLRGEPTDGAWRFKGEKWTADKSLTAGLVLEGNPLRTSLGGRERGVRFRDVDNDGTSELIVGNDSQNAVFAWSESGKSWRPLAYSLPRGAAIVTANGGDAGTRFVDVNGDGFDDVLRSNASGCSLHLFVPGAKAAGWSQEVFSQDTDASQRKLPTFVREGEHPNNGIWFQRKTVWFQNEDTAYLPDKVDRRTFQELLTVFVTNPSQP